MRQREKSRKFSTEINYQSCCCRIGSVEVQTIQARNSKGLAGTAISCFQNFSREIIIGAKILKVFRRNLLHKCLLVEIQFKLIIHCSISIDDMESAVEVAGHEEIAVWTAGNREFIEDAFVLIELTEFALQGFKDWDCHHWLVRHGYVPNFDVQKVPREDVLAVLSESRIGNGGNYLREEVLLRRVFFFQESHGSVIADAALSHISNLGDTLGSCVKEHVVMGRMKLRRSNDFREFFEVIWFQIHSYKCLRVKIKENY